MSEAKPLPTAEELDAIREGVRAVVTKSGDDHWLARDMQPFNLRSNAIAPFAWTRMIDPLPTNTPEQQRRVEGLKKLEPEKIAPIVVALASNAGAGVTGQIFGVRNHEIYLFSQPRPIRTAHSSDGWTPEMIAERVFPMFASDFYPLHRSGDVFTWDPV